MDSSWRVRHVRRVDGRTVVLELGPDDGKVVALEWTEAHTGGDTADARLNARADAAATEALRTEIRAQRKQGRPGTWALEDRVAGDGETRIGENVMARDGGLACRRCETILTGASGRVVEATAPLAKAGPWIALRWGGDSPNFALAEIACPGCGTLLSVSEVRM